MPRDTTAPKRQRILTFLTPRVQDTMFMEVVEGFRRTHPEYGTPHPDRTRWPNHVLAFIDQADAQGALFNYVYLAKREHQDAYNWEFTKADIGGNRFDAVQRTYVTFRSEINPLAPTMGDTMPDQPAGLFVGDYVLAQREQRRIGQERLDTLFVVDVQTYVKRCQQVNVQDDDATSTRLSTISNLYFGTELVPGSGSPLKTAAALFADPSDPFWQFKGPIINEGRQLSCAWFEITSQQVAPSGGTDPITGAPATFGTLLRAFCTMGNYGWPGVLRTVDTDQSGGATLNNDNSIVFKALTVKRADGDSYDEIIPRVVLSVPPYRGPTLMLVEEWWVARRIPCDRLPKVDAMLPQEIAYQGANYNLRIEPTLHGAFNLIDNIGTGDPRFEQSQYGQAIPPTNYVNWPVSLIIDVEQVPFRGGYKVRVVRAARPPVPIYRPFTGEDMSILPWPEPPDDPGTGVADPNPPVPSQLIVYLSPDGSEVYLAPGGGSVYIVPASSVPDPDPDPDPSATIYVDPTEAEAYALGDDLYTIPN